MLGIDLSKPFRFFFPKYVAEAKGNNIADRYRYLFCFESNVEIQVRFLVSVTS